MLDSISSLEQKWPKIFRPFAAIQSSSSCCWVWWKSTESSVTKNNSGDIMVTHVPCVKCFQCFFVIPVPYLINAPKFLLLWLANNVVVGQMHFSHGFGVLHHFSVVFTSVDPRPRACLLSRYSQPNLRFSSRKRLLHPINPWPDLCHPSPTTSPSYLCLQVTAWVL